MENSEDFKYNRRCPRCNKEITYAYSSGYSRAKTKNSMCAGCVKIGNDWTWNKGKKLPEPMRSKVIAAGLINLQKIVIPFTAEHCNNISRSQKGKKLTIDHKRRIRLGVIRSRSQNLKLYPNYTKYACQLFDEINHELGWRGQHAENGGEFFIRELGYWVDYYEPNLNIIIEFDDKNHKYRKEKDEIRQQEITNHIQCKFYRLSETDNWRDIIK